MKSVYAIALVGWSCACAHATVTFDIDALNLRTAGGQYMPLGGQIFLVASTSDAVFGAPTPSSFVTGDDLILGRWTLAGSGAGGSGDPGIGFFQGSAPGLTLDSSLTTGDPVELYWFPTLTLSSTSPGEGTSYGYYRDAVGIDGSAPWVIPADGATVYLRFLTADYGGTNPESAGVASSTTVPEPGSLTAMVLVLGWFALRLTRPRDRKS